MFSDSATTLGPIPSEDVSSVWGEVFSDVYYVGTKAADVPLGGVITPIQGDSWSSATTLVAYQVVQVSESKVICKKCYDSSKAVGLVESSVAPVTSVFGDPTSLPDVNAIGETVVSRPTLPVCPDNISLSNGCPVYAFTDWSIKSISVKENNNSFMQLCGDVGFVGAKHSLVRSIPVRAEFNYDKSEDFSGPIQFSVKSQGPKHSSLNQRQIEFFLSLLDNDQLPVSAFKAIAMRDLQNH